MSDGDGSGSWDRRVSRYQGDPMKDGEYFFVLSLAKSQVSGKTTAKECADSLARYNERRRCARSLVSQRGETMERKRAERM